MSYKVITVSVCGLELTAHVVNGLVRYVEKGKHDITGLCFIRQKVQAQVDEMLGKQEFEKENMSYDTRTD